MHSWAAAESSTPSHVVALRLVPRTTEPPPAWQCTFDALLAFAQRHGHCVVPYRERVAGRNLYAWAAKQRARRMMLTETQRDLLESLPGWTWNVRDAAWEASFAAVERFVEREGHCRAPRSHVEDGLAIGRWLSAQRQRLPSMSGSRRRRLEALPGWTTDARFGRWWESRAAVARFARTYGHARVPYDCEFEGHRLGMWVARQRSAYRRGRLAEARIDALEALPGWCWNPGARISRTSGTGEW